MVAASSPDVSYGLEDEELSLKHDVIHSGYAAGCEGGSAPPSNLKCNGLRPRFGLCPKIGQPAIRLIVIPYGVYSSSPTCGELYFINQ